MDIERGNLEILFQWIPYDKVTIWGSDFRERHDCFHVNEAFYLEQCHRVFEGRSEDEQKNYLAYLREKMGCKPRYRGSVFQLILDAADKLLDYQAGEVLCRFRELLRWREISLPLGQEIFVCAYLADRDIYWRERRRSFSWLPILMSDNRRILAVLKKGIAENHFHLKGSSRIFEVSWICLMNHIIGRREDFQRIGRELQRNGGHERNFGLSLYRKCQRAALYRLYLFSVLRGDYQLRDELAPWLVEERLAVHLGDLQNAINRAQIRHGSRIFSTFQGWNGLSEEADSEVLDYAFLREIYDENQSSYRILAGERWFLYECFRACLNEEFLDYQQNIFYRYLKLRTAFRQEMVQVNKEVGFKNFSEYQDRKEIFIERQPFHGYRREFLLMATRGQLDRPYLRSLEMRLTPGESSRGIHRVLREYQSMATSRNVPEDGRTRYVMHFPKRADGDGGILAGWIPAAMRNEVCRAQNRNRAMALRRALETCGFSLRRRIVGIDACANEIGCRPETFGQIFRYLRSVNFGADGDGWIYREDRMEIPAHQLCLTYHVGEDFLDIVDGLRAIDEALLFCGLDRGSRIGHGLALGIEPTDYYAGKAFRLVLPKQELMDDIAWLLCVADENGCAVDGCLRTELLRHFQALFQDVYRNYYLIYVGGLDSHACPQTGMPVADYFRSWKLRGDDPQLYRMDWEDFQARNAHRGDELVLWDRFAFNGGLDRTGDAGLREAPMYYYLNWCYAFDADVRRRGREKEPFKVEPAYVALVRQVQDCMMEKLVKKGIAIETNPSSNYLIGTIKRYDQHPVLRFNARKLAKTTPHMSLSVSLNTDDQGVFDTLLENEYALMALALEKAKDENGQLKYDIEDIYEWLDYVRQMGMEQIFGNRLTPMCS